MEDVLEKVLNIPLAELEDSEVLDLLDSVSQEVQRRNRIMGAGGVHDAVAGILDTFISRIKLPELKE